MRWNDGCDILLSLIFSICSHYVDASSSVDFVSETLKIINDYKGGADEFGFDIAVSEDLLVVGAPGELGENYTTKGSVTVFRRQNGVVQQPGKKLLGMRRDIEEKRYCFGNYVAVNDDFIVVGSDGDGHIGITSIYRSYEPYELVKTIQKVDSVASGEWRAWGVIINNEITIFIGDPYSEHYHGAVHIYSNDKLSENWTLSQTLKPPVAQNVSYFGRYIGSSPQYLVVTSKSNKIVFIYRKNTNGVWNFDQKLTHSIPFRKVIIESERLFIGSYNKVYVYNLLNSTWSLNQTIQPPDIAGFRIYEFASDISVQDDVLVIGAPVTTFKDAEAGACFLYVLNKKTSNWIVRAVLMAPNGAKDNQYLGTTLVLYDNKVFVHSYDIARNFSGSVHEYEVSFSQPENNFLAWYVILIIVLIALLIVIVPLLLVIRYKKKRTNNTVDVQ